jgi:hypothetical protein
MGGRIEVDSAPGEETTFPLELPAELDPDASDDEQVEPEATGVWRNLRSIALRSPAPASPASITVPLHTATTAISVGVGGSPTRSCVQF